MSNLTGSINRALEKVAQFGRGSDAEKLTATQAGKLEQLREHGYVIFDHLVGTPEMNALHADYIERLEKKLDFDFPVLAQAKIDPERHADLIRKQFLATPEQLEKLGLTFNKSDVKSYEHAVAEFAPSTLTTQIPDSVAWFNVWLDPNVMAVASAYMGFVPELTEAYVRRNFPARFSVMNHAWHRDTNHRTHLLKMFIFLNDCTLKNGPHYYISGSVQDRTIEGSGYFSDEQIREVYPPQSGREIVSVVPAGTLILEDTRGLHKAGIPDEGYRDLGFATFVPAIALRKREPLYHIGRQTYNTLEPEQRLFIPADNVRQ